MLTVIRRLCIGLLCGLVVAGSPAVVWAATSQPAEGIAQSYTAEVGVRQGMIVGLKQGESTKVVPLERDRVKDMLGVVISASDAPLRSINSSRTDAEVGPVFMIAIPDCVVSKASTYRRSAFPVSDTGTPA